MGLSKAAPGQFCDHCKMEYGSYNSEYQTWSFRARRKGEGPVDPTAYLTVTSEMSKSNGAVRHYCRYHLQEASRWRNADGLSTWTIANQIAYAKQMEMAAANV